MKNIPNERNPHSHDFRADTSRGEHRTAIVFIITIVTMGVEIVAGLMTGSMALLADGLHMGTHAAAMVITLGAYSLARRHSDNPAFTFGTWKIEVLGAYTSAIVLAIVGLSMIYASVERIVHPQSIDYGTAILVAVIGLVINIVCALLLSSSHGHEHEHRNDINLRSAYLHVLADALTSVLAIAALAIARLTGFTLLDPLIGIVGATLILKWAYSLVAETASILLQINHDPKLEESIRFLVESDHDSRIIDFHLWEVEHDRFACIVSVETSHGLSRADYLARICGIDALAHINIEVVERTESRR